MKGPAPDATRLPEYAGAYTNDELRATWTLIVQSGELIRQQWMTEDQELQPVFPMVSSPTSAKANWSCTLTATATAESQVSRGHRHGSAHEVHQRFCPSRKIVSPARFEGKN